MIAVILEVHKAAEQAVIGSHRVIGVEECLGCNKPVLVHAEAFPADEGVVPFVLAVINHYHSAFLVFSEGKESKNQNTNVTSSRWLISASLTKLLA